MLQKLRSFPSLFPSSHYQTPAFLEPYIQARIISSSIIYLILSQFYLIFILTPHSPKSATSPFSMGKSVPSYEKPLHDRFIRIREQLLGLKNNRSKYISLKQVHSIYDEFLGVLHELLLTRKDEELKGITLVLPNATDLIVDDIWTVTSLCFVTCGLTKFAPATYSSLSTVHRLLEHLKDCQVYTMDDLEPIRSRLEEIREIINNLSENDMDESIVDPEDIENDKKHKVEEQILLRNKLNKCSQALAELEAGFQQIPDDLEPVYSELVLLRKKLLQILTSLNAKTLLSQKATTTQDQTSSELEVVKAKLKKIEALRDSEGKFPLTGAEQQVEASAMVLNGLLDDCNTFISDLNVKQNDSDILSLLSGLSLNDSQKETATIFQGLYNKLTDIKGKLENLLVTRRWTMRETDLFNFLKQLKEIDELRNQALQKSDKSNAGIRKFHMIILYLLRRCYSQIYKLLESSEPVSESLQPIHNQLQTVRRCLLELKRVDGLNNLKELYPFQFKLASLDNLREDGKFIVNGTIPEGQGLLNALLAECFDILHELKIELEEKEYGSGQEDMSDDDDKGNITDDEDIHPDDEVELKRKRFMGFNEADYDQDSEEYDSESLSDSEDEYEGNDYY